jgi:hypothetical protein
MYCNSKGVVIPHQEVLWFRKIQALLLKACHRIHASLLHLAGGEEDTNGRGVPVLIFS